MAGPDFETGNIYTYAHPRTANIDVVTGADGKFYFAHWISNTEISVKQWDGSQWVDYTTLTNTIAGIETFSDSFDLEIDAAGALHIAYVQFKLYGSDILPGIGYGKYDGSWATSTVEKAFNASVAGTFGSVSLDLGANGLPHVAYEMSDIWGPQYHYLKHAWHTAGVSWTPGVVKGMLWSADDVKQSWLGVGTQQPEHMTYVGVDGLYHSRRDDSKWSTPQKILDVAGAVSYGTPLLSADGTLHLFYSVDTGADENVSSILYVASNKTGAWVSEVLAEHEGGLLRATALQEVNGVQYLLMNRLAPDGTLEAAHIHYRPEGGTWQLGKEISLPPDASETVMGVNAAGQFMILVQDGAQQIVSFTTGLATDPPLLSSGAETANFVEGTSAIIDPGLELSDADSSALASATVSISSGLQAGDTLNVGATFGNITADYDHLTGKLLLSSAGATATLAEWQNTLRSVTFDHQTDAPSEDDRVITFVVSDGIANSTPSTTTLTVTGVNDVPTGELTVSGIPLQGETLTAISTLDDPDGIGALSYQWFADNAAISGATASTYVLTQDEVDKRIEVRVTYTDDGGTVESVASAETGAVKNVNDPLTGNVVITGAVEQGSTLTANTSGLVDPDGLDTFSYQWIASGVAIAGATQSTYELTQIDVDKTIKVEVSYIDKQGTPEAVTSAETEAVMNVNDEPQGKVVIDGIVEQNRTLAADTSGLADPDGLGEFSYQWFADGNPIDDATGNTYALTQREVGKAISVQVSYTDEYGADESIVSLSTAQVANVNDEPSGDVAISGTARQGQTLAADISGLDDLDGLGTPSYQWLADGEAIPGATASTYVLTQDDVDKEIQVRVSYTDDGGTAESVISQKTAAVENVNDDPAGSVTIAGAATQNQTLTADIATLHDADGIGEVSYQWFADGVEIPDATGKTHTLTQAQVGKEITVRVDYTDLQDTEETVTSAATGQIVNVNDAPTGSVIIEGILGQGETLAADASGVGDVDGLNPFSYQWLADGVAIAGATGSTYVLTQGEVGKEITVEVSYTDGYGATESVTSARTAAVANVNDEPTGTVVITGQLDQGETLFADTSAVADADGLNPDSFAYQWRADGVDIPGATGAHLLLSQGEVGKAISVVVRYTDDGGQAESVASTATAAIRNINDAPTLTGLPEQPVQIPAWPASRLPHFAIEDIDGGDEVLTLTLVATNARVAGVSDADKVEPGVQLRGTAAELTDLLTQARLRPERDGDISLELTLRDDHGASQTATLAFVAESLPPPLPPAPALIDGVAVSVRTTTDEDGTVLREVVVPVVTQARVDTDDHSALADIPLVGDDDHGNLLTAHLPAGFGLTALGTPAPQAASSLQDGLIAAIRAHTEAGSEAQATMLGGGVGFLEALEPADELLVYRLTLIAPGDAPPAQPLVIAGAPATLNAAKTALVIDASQLPAGSVIHLEDVAFAVVVGQVQVAGGSGAQVVSADDAAQTLVLGEADDILHAGGGDDTVGSAGGNDRIHGNAGDDILFGGAGSDFLHGGSGQDIARFDGDAAAYAITRDHAITVVRSLDDPTDVDTLVNVETLQFADGSVEIRHEDILGTLAGLYQQVLHRQADLEGIQYWAKAHAGGMNLGDIALSFVWSDEALVRPGTADPVARAATVEVLYEQLLDRQPDEEGQAYWVDRLADGMTLGDVAVSILHSAEMQALQPAPGDWEFFT